MILLDDNSERREIERLYLSFMATGHIGAKILLNQKGISIRDDAVSSDCAMHALSRAGIPCLPGIADIVFSERFEVPGLSSPREGSSYAARYYLSESSGFTNTALSIGDGMFESKWDLSLIVNHPLEMVPASYGRIVRFFEIGNEARAAVQNHMMGMSNTY